MREILFKAKRIDNNEWAEGYYSAVSSMFPVSGQNSHYIQSYTILEPKHHSLGNMLIMWKRIINMTTEKINKILGEKEKIICAVQC